LQSRTKNYDYITLRGFIKGSLKSVFAQHSHEVTVLVDRDDGKTISREFITQFENVIK